MLKREFLPVYLYLCFSSISFVTGHARFYNKKIDTLGNAVLCQSSKVLVLFVVLQRRRRKAWTMKICQALNLLQIKMLV